MEVLQTNGASPLKGFNPTSQQSATPSYPPFYPHYQRPFGSYAPTNFSAQALSTPYHRPADFSAAAAHAAQSQLHVPQFPHIGPSLSQHSPIKYYNSQASGQQQQSGHSIKSEKSEPCAGSRPTYNPFQSFTDTSASQNEAGSSTPSPAHEVPSAPTSISQLGMGSAFQPTGAPEGPIDATRKAPTSPSDNTSSPASSTTSERDCASTPHSTISSTKSGSGAPMKKKGIPVPMEKKDGMYWEKRHKNNLSAKRSRDIRRQKEEQVAMKVVYLEQENLSLRTEVGLLRGEIDKLRCMLYQS